MSQDSITAMLHVAEAIGSSDKLSVQVQGLIDEAHTRPLKDERRARDRFPIPYTFRLTPLDDDGVPVMDDTTTVVGKDLSLIGIGFSHDQPLPTKRILITLNHPKVGQFAVEAEVIWTRPTPIGLFESGCKLVRTIGGHTVRPKG